jgi:hypothetical protein
MNAAQKLKFDVDIAPVEQKELAIDRANAEAMKVLTGGRSGPKPVPLKDRRRKRE